MSFGRLYSPDERDRHYLLAAPRETAETHRWPTPRPRDQGRRPWCVSFALKHALACGPFYRVTGTPEWRAMPGWRELYCEAQARDEWPGDCSGGPSYDGTSVRGGAKALRDTGLVTAFFWADDVGTARRWVANRGPLVAGTTWYERMSDPKPQGFVELGGAVQGGHAYVLVGYDADLDSFLCMNSWGRWGPLGGYFWLRADHLGELLADDGELCYLDEVAA